jgi:hypothetical protein
MCKVSKGSGPSTNTAALNIVPGFLHHWTESDSWTASGEKYVLTKLVCA